MYKVWFNRELQSEQTRLPRKQIANALWQKYVEGSNLSDEEILTQFTCLQGFLSNSRPINYFGDAKQYSEAVKEKFAFAIKNKNYKSFVNLFKSLSLNELRMINNGEGLGLKIPEHKLAYITEKSVCSLQEYLDNTGYSASISIMSNNTNYSIASKRIDPQLPFNMFSVGKIFTGVLLLQMVQQGIIKENNLHEAIQLDHAILEKLPLQVKEQLHHITLHQIMTHTAGLADYLDQYRKMLEEGTAKDIKTARDFVPCCEKSYNLIMIDKTNSQYELKPYSYYLEKMDEQWRLTYVNGEMTKIDVKIDDVKGLHQELQTLAKKPFNELTENDLHLIYTVLNQHYCSDQVGKFRYSNVGILLVGLAIEHAYHLETENNKHYQEILDEFIIKSANMTIFSSQRPQNGQYNINDPFSQYIVGSPAGAYWTTAEDLQKFGSWLIQKCNKDSEFMRLLEKYGSEFYSSAKREIAHTGDIPSASAFLICSLDSGTTIAVLSDQGRVASKLGTTIVEQSAIDNASAFMRTLTSNKLGFFRKLEEEFLIERRHDNADSLRKYNERFGLVLYNK